MIIYIIVAVVVVVLIALVLRPGAEVNGGSLDLFLGENSSDASDDDRKNAQEAEEAKYSEVYTEEGKQVLVLYATEYGFSEEVGKKLFDHLYAPPACQPRVVNARDREVFDLMKEQAVLIVSSTTGDGVPPTDARDWLEDLVAKDRSSYDLSHLRYSVLALGDSNYTHYCKTGRTIDATLEALGAKRVVDKAEVDQEDWPVIDAWFAAVKAKLHELDLDVRADYIVSRSGSAKQEKHGRLRPFAAEMVTKYDITDVPPEDDEERKVIHAEFKLEAESELSYTAGDALGIYPLNNPPEVAALLAALGQPGGDSLVPVPKMAYEPKPEKEMPLKEALSRFYDLKTIQPSLINLIKERTGDATERAQLEELLRDGGASISKNRRLKEYIELREVADVLEEFPSAIQHKKVSVTDVLTNMKILQPRYYSISSSPVIDKSIVSVTASVVRYETLGKKRTGVTTTFLCDRFDVNQRCPVFINKNPEFRLPGDGATDIIMIGPGTGIAPFRAFIHERVASKAAGTNLLYFGCRHRATDFLYREELEKLDGEGKIKLRTAFSRDQERKVYVQHRIAEDKDAIWSMLEGGAHVYVCGDAKHMAGDVHNALLTIIRDKSGCSDDEAQQYMHKLEASKRYQRDVWV